MVGNFYLIVFLIYASLVHIEFLSFAQSMAGQATYTTGTIFYHSRYCHLMKTLPFVDIFYFSSDNFDENTPPLSDPNYISSLGAATFRGMQSGDEDAIWLMQVSYLCIIICCYLQVVCL